MQSRARYAQLATNTPNVPLPAGSEVLTDWEDGLRVVTTPRRLLPGTRLLVSAVASQRADGTIFARQDVADAKVYIDELGEHGEAFERLAVSGAEARVLAAALIEAADLLEGWAK
ncbi:hypothetical protein [Mycobacterium helveticum]|uniref:Uncharacterized protein n=1 Tax=Mycobacterium helveticum TaxID=2592811 RepID=A0A557XTM5_9MYCO|nr:hypothetical protein [Mycobacterium helveticum]TVS85213.1 hypothetical protein FPZ46_15310 [Mycobacterium helveticum]TVS89319.1 hypothetical protein FPZ47_12075 [Mycobacterium helveticum]